MNGCMKLPLSGALAVLSVCAAASAQVHPGMDAPALAVDWQGAPPVRFRGAGAAPCAIVAFHRTPAAAAIDADLLRDLLARHGDRGLRVAVVLPASVAPAPPIAGVAVGIDGDGAARTAWLGQEVDFHMALVCNGRIGWIGGPAEALLATAAAAMRGALDPATEGETRRRRRQLFGTFDGGDPAATRALAAGLTQTWPTDGAAWGLCYLVDSQQLGDRAAARLTCGAALEALPAEPRALAAFADLALRGNRHDHDLAPRLTEALAKAAAAYPDDLRVQLTRLRGLVRQGDDREVGRLVGRLGRRVEGVPAAALEFVEILTRAATPELHKELVVRALAAATGPEVDPRHVVAARYAATLRCMRDPAAAREIANDAMERDGGRAALNNEAWTLLTELGTCGRFDAFALALVRRMLLQRDALEAFELDTAALAMFCNGEFDEAVALQEAAVGRDADTVSYRERLARYRAVAAKATSPR